MTKLLTQLARWWLSRMNRIELQRAVKNALPDGTRVQLECSCRGFGPNAHEGVWTTQYKLTADDYRLTRESDGEITYAVRKVLKVLV